jgi:hypothetical protein
MERQSPGSGTQKYDSSEHANTSGWNEPAVLVSATQHKVGECIEMLNKNSPDSSDLTKEEIAAPRR